MTLAEGKEYIYSGWRASGITDAVQMSKVNLPPTDLFNDLNPQLPSKKETQEFNSVIVIPEEQNGLRCSSDDDSEWEYDERSAFDAFIVDE